MHSPEPKLYFIQNLYYKNDHLQLRTFKSRPPVFSIFFLKDEHWLKIGNMKNKRKLEIGNWIYLKQKIENWKMKIEILKQEIESWDWKLKIFESSNRRL